MDAGSGAGPAPAAATEAPKPGSAESLLQYVDEIEQLMAAQADLQESINSLYARADREGFNKKAIKECIKLRALDPEEVFGWDLMMRRYRIMLGIRVLKDREK